jgi:hypothetical protein
LNPRDVKTARVLLRHQAVKLIQVERANQRAERAPKYGRLSMWRAYGGDTNVAFVFNNKPFFNDKSTTNAFSSPVLYCDRHSFLTNFEEVVANLETHLELAKQIGGEALKGILEGIFHFAAISPKHPGFAEEKEWRVIFSPTIFPSERLGYDLEVVGGVPQRVYKFPLENFPEDEVAGVTLSELLEEIIIGPTQNAYTVYNALVDALDKAGVEDAARKVRISDIPLRR